MDESYGIRLSFCCATEGCRRRTTPPSVRFLGRKGYLGVLVVLITAMEHGLSAKRRRQLIDTLDIPPQTLWRWQHWWRDVFAEGPLWRMERGRFMPPVPVGQLSGGLLGRLFAADLRGRLIRLLHLIAPVTTPRGQAVCRRSPIRRRCDRQASGGAHSWAVLTESGVSDVSNPTWE
jgi:hypothetical protein